MNESDFIPDWYIGEQDIENGLRNISNIRGVTDGVKVFNP